MESSTGAGAAVAAGAARIELCDNLAVGGTTPSYGVIRAAVAFARERGVDVMCMVRPREGGFCYTDFDYDAICRDALALIRAGADGIVFGFLKPGGTVDEARCADFLGCIRAEKPRSRRFSTARSTSCRTSLRRSTR